MKVRSNIKNLKRTEITPYMKGDFPPQRPALYAKVLICKFRFNYLRAESQDQNMH